MRISLILVLVFLSIGLVGITLAQDQVLPAKEPLPELPDPGLKPGDFFYFLDQWLEAIREFLTFNSEAKALYQTERALERIAEIKALLAEKGVAAPGLDVALSKIQTNMEKAAQILEEQKSKGKDIKKLAQILDDHFDARENLLEEVFKIEKEKLKAKEKDIKNQIREARLAGNFDKIAELEAILADIKTQKEALEREKDRQEEILEAEEEKLENLLEEKEKEIEELEEEEEDLFEQREKDLEREFEQREKALEAQEKALEIDLQKAIREGNTELADQIRAQLQDIKAQKEALEREEEATEEELEKEEKKAEQMQSLSEKAREQIEEAEEELAEAKEEAGELKEVPNAVTVLLAEAEDKLNKAKAAFDEGKFGEAFGQATATEMLARDAERKIEQQKEVEEELEEEEEQSEETSPEE